MSKRSRWAVLKTSQAGAIEGRARTRRVLRLDLESLESRQLLTLPTATALSSSTVSATLHLPVTLTAHVATVPPGAGTPTGKVTFLDGATSIGSVTVPASGNVFLMTSTLGLGTHTITATYPGDANDSPSTSTPIKLYVGEIQKFDFDGDGLNDIGVYGKDPSSGNYDFRSRTVASGYSSPVTFDNNGAPGSATPSRSPCPPTTSATGAPPMPSGRPIPMPMAS